MVNFGRIAGNDLDVCARELLRQTTYLLERKVLFDKNLYLMNNEYVPNAVDVVIAWKEIYKIEKQRGVVY